jgi:hypothetical protein
MNPLLTTRKILVQPDTKHGDDKAPAASPLPAQDVVRPGNRRVPCWASLIGCARRARRCIVRAVRVATACCRRVPVPPRLPQVHLGQRTGFFNEHSIQNDMRRSEEAQRYTARRITAMARNVMRDADGRFVGRWDPLLGVVFTGRETDGLDGKTAIRALTRREKELIAKLREDVLDGA